MERAEKAASDSVILERVKKVKLQVLASEYALYPQDFYERGKWPEFKTLVLKYNAYIKLGVGPEKFIPEFESMVKKEKWHIKESNITPLALLFSSGALIVTGVGLKRRKKKTA